MAKEAIPRLPSGLVDLACYQPYLVDPPLKVPTILPVSRDTYRPSSLNWMYQHVIFEGDKWRQAGYEWDEKPDLNRTIFRGYIYNQLVMRPRKEQKWHSRYEDHIEWDSIPDSTVEAAVQNFRTLDEAAAAALCIELSRRPQMFDEYVRGTGPTRFWREFSDNERIDFFEEELDRAFWKLRSSQVDDHQLLASALKRTAREISNPMLDSLANEIAFDSFIYPVRVRHTNFLYRLGDVMLKNSWEEVETIELPQDEGLERAA